MNELSIFDTLFGDGFAVPNYRTNTCTPKVDVVQAKAGYVLSMDLPGKTEKDVEITLKNDVLTIASVEEAEKGDSKEKEEKPVYLLSERNMAASKFRRSFTMPKDINPENVTASFKNGVLEVTIARKEESQEKRISINVA